MATQVQKFRFTLSADQHILVTVSETAQATIETNAWDPERPIFNAALAGMLKLIEIAIEDGATLPVGAVRAAFRELSDHDFKLPIPETHPTPNDYTVIALEVVAKGKPEDVQEGLWMLLSSVPGIRKVDFTGQENPSEWDLELEPEDFEEDDLDLPGADEDDLLAHRYTSGFCSLCDGPCQYDNRGEFVGDQNNAVFSD